MNWGAKIVLSFVLFTIVIFTMVYISMDQEVNLVSIDYYKQELAYQSQINRIKNTKALVHAPAIDFDRNRGSIVIHFTPELSERMIEGEVYLFRPSDAKMDIRSNLELDANYQQIISLDGREKGLWKVKLSWKDNKSEYYDEKVIIY